MSAGLPVRQTPSLFGRWRLKVPYTCRCLNSTTAVQPQNPAYPFYPSVTSLLHEKSIPDSEASKIPASGPKGRLLKGDVLAYLGAIAADYPSSQAARLEKLSHLDLSNIKIAAAAKPAEKEETKAQPAAEEAAPAAPVTSVAISISLAAALSVQNKIKENMGTTIPLSTFLARATDLANEELPRSKMDKRSSDELFEEILGAPAVNTSRGDYIPELNAVELEGQGLGESAEPIQTDIIDFLSGKKTTKKAPFMPQEQLPAGSALNVFSLTVPVGEEKRARVFLERIKTLLQTEPGRLVL